MGIDGFSMVELASQLRHAKANSSVRAGLLHVSSPGGTVSGTKDLSDAVREFVASGKPLVVYGEDIVASAAYWISSGATAIVANPTAEIGSIGVFCVIPDTSRLFEDNGIKMNLVKSAPRKGDGSMGIPVSQEALDDTQRIVNDIHELFVADVAAGRGMRVKWERGNAEAKPVPDDGRVWLAEEALDMGLIDRIGNFEAAYSHTQSLISNSSVWRTTRQMSKVAEALDLSADADEDQIVNALAEKVEKRASELAAAKEAAAKARAEQLIQEATEKAAAEKLDTERSAFVDGALKAGRINSNQAESANKLIRSSESDAFREFVGKNAATAPTTAPVIATDVRPPAAIDTVTPEGRAALDKRAKEIMSTDASLTYSAAIAKAVAEAKK